jgi:hypothetical protein
MSEEEDEDTDDDRTLADLKRKKGAEYLPRGYEFSWWCQLPHPSKVA